MLSYACTNNCDFCLEADNRAQENLSLQPFALNRITAFFKKNSGKYSSLFITGGEPTLYPYFFDVLYAAKSHGFEVHLNTNGVMLSSYSFAAKVVPFIDEIVISMHGHNAGLHDSHTNNPGSFKKVIGALRNILDINPRINLLTNSVVTKYNFPYLKDIIIGLHNLGVKRVLFSNMVPVTANKKFIMEYTVRLSKWEKKAHLIFNLAQILKMNIRIFGVPSCVLPDFSGNIDDCSAEANEQYDRMEYKKGSLRLRKINRSTPMAAKTRLCRVCKKNNFCKGIFRPYYKLYGDSELKPIK